MNPVGRLLFKLLVAVHVTLFRLTGGRRFNRSPFGSPLLLLTTTGRRSGKRRTVPITYMPDGDDLVVIGSAGGADSHPGWAVNLRANPEAEIEMAGKKRTVRGRWTKGADRERVWGEVKRRYPSFAQYEQRTNRVIPVIRLQPDTSDIAGRATT